MDLFNENNQGETSPFGNNPETGFSPLGLGEPTPEPPKNIKKILGIGLAIASIGLVGAAGFMVYNKNQETVIQQQRELEVIENLNRELNTAVSGFSTLALQEKTEDDLSVWDANLSYVEMSESRVAFANKVASHVRVSLTEDGKAKVTYPNFDYIAYVMKTQDNGKVVKLVEGLDAKSHTYKSDLTDAYAKYIAENLDDMLAQSGDYSQNHLKSGDTPIPTLELEIKDVLTKGKVKSSLFLALDELTFSSVAFHNSLDTFSMLAKSSFGKTTETEEHALWAKLYNSTYEDLSVLRSEYLKEEGYQGAGGSVLSETKDPTVQAYLTALSEMVLVEPIPYSFENPDAQLEKTIPHSWVGVGYVKSDGSDAVSVSVSKGIGSYDEPYTLGTPFVTKAMGTDGNYHDVKVTLKGIKLGEEAIADVLTYDEKNQGFTTDSQMTLATFTFDVENLENEEIEINSEFTLSDSGLNLTPRTGNMFSMPERAKIPARGVANMADWVYAKDTSTLSLLWGKTFNRQHPAFFMNVLGNEVFDTYGRVQDRVTKEHVENEAQKTVDKLKEQVESSKQGD